MATRRLVEKKLRELIRRLEDAGSSVHGSLAESLPESKVIEVRIVDLDAFYWTEMAGGRMAGLHTGRHPSADIRVRVDSDHLVDLVDGERSLFSSYMGGHIKIEASLTDLMRLRKLA